MHISKNRVKFMALWISVLISVTLIIILSNVVDLTLKKISQQEQINVLERLINYKSEIEKEINSRIVLANGYLAFIKSYPHADKETSLRYLGNLIDPKDKLIKNISVLRDTTIVWTYPAKGNEGAVGKDLAKVPEQRDSVLSAKNKGVTIFQGPVHLVQGGTGFVSRVPAYDDGNKYWGQISIVINGEELIKSLSELEKVSSLRVSFYNKKDYPEHPFFGKKILEEEKPLVFSTSINDAEWVIAAVPSKGWENNRNLHISWNIAVCFFSVFIGTLIYNYIYKSYQIKQQVNYDALTGVQSRAFLDSYVQMIFSRAGRTDTKIGIMVIDLNNFKSINDKYGHLAGDKALKAVASRLTASCRANDSVVRIGGDEFLMIFTDVKRYEDFDKISKKIENRSQFLMNFKGEEIKFSYSVGTALFPDEGKSIDEVIHCADEKMYFNKNKRENKN